MELKKIFNSWAGGVGKEYARKQWLLSKWELFEGVDWPREKCEIMVKSIADGLKLSARDSLVDLGCGGGWIMDALKKSVRRVYGLDISTEMLTFARETLKKDILTCGEIGQLPFKSGSIDKVLSYYVFLNFSDDQYVERSIREVMRILAKGGRALIGQLADVQGSAAYDRAKADYFEYCQKTYKLGKSNRDTHLPPLRLFDRERLAGFLKKEKIPFSFRKSFNPFYRPGQPESIDWRFDLVLEKV